MYECGNIITRRLRPIALRSRSLTPKGKALPMTSRSVVVAGRRPPMLRSLKRLLEPRFEVAAMTDNVLSMLDALKEISPDLLVLDTASQEFGAPDLPVRLRQRYPGLRIVLVGDDPEPPPPSATADVDLTYVSKDSAGDALIPAADALLARSRPATKSDQQP